MFEAHFFTAAEETLTHSNPPSRESNPVLPSNQDQQRLFKRALQHPRYNCAVWIWNAFGKKSDYSNTSKLHEFIHLEYKKHNNETGSIFVESSIPLLSSDAMIEQLLSTTITDISPQKSDEWLHSLQNEGI
ncbi:hypothetical protein [Neptunomonas sp.]